MLDANAATISLPGALVKISSKASTTSRSEPVKPRRSMFVLSANSASTPFAAELREPVHVEMLAVERRLVDLEVAGVDDDAGRRMDGERDAVGDAVRDADEFDLERADGHAVARPHRDQLRGRRCRAPRASARPARASAACRRPGRRRAATRAARRRCDPRARASARAPQRALSAAGTVRSGMIRSTPSSSGSGNITPASTTIVVSPHVSASMFMPNSPRPPSATTSSIRQRGCTHQHRRHSWRRRSGDRSRRRRLGQAAGCA